MRLAEAQTFASSTIASKGGGARNRCSSRGFTKYGLNIWVRAFPYPSSAGAPPAAGYLASVPACQPCDKVHPQVRCAAAT